MKTYFKTLAPLAILVTSFHHSHVAAQSLEFYGLAHASTDHVGTGEVKSDIFASNSSRVGVRGRYQLTESWSLFYQYESGLDLTLEGDNDDGNGGVDDGNRLLSKTRPSFIGIESKFGKLSYGHMDMLDVWANDYNLFADRIGDLGNLWAGSGLPGRLDDVINYTSPESLPIHVSVSYRDKDLSDDILKLRGVYKYQDWSFALTHFTAEQEEGVAEDHTATSLVFKYTADKFTFGGGIQLESDIAGQSGADKDHFSLGASYQLYPSSEVRALIAHTSGSVDDSDAFMWAVSYDYKLRDNVILYAAYSKMFNDKNVNFSVNGKGHGNGLVPLNGVDPYALSLGVIVDFQWTIFD